MKNIIAFFLLINALVLNDAHAQQTSAGKLRGSFDKYLEHNFQEKIYMHTDKDAYLAGEIIWFKIYNVEAYTNRPVEVSKVAYVELLDSQNKAVLQAKVKLQDGQGSGTLYAPVNLPSGSYILRSYTSWMKNADAAYYFHKSLDIYNTLKEEPLEPHTKAGSFALRFFPEGGNLVSGLTSKVAFKAVDENGNNFPFKAIVLNSANDTVASFSSTKTGIGSFEFTPNSKQTYKAIVKPLAASAFTVLLPQIFENGAVMSLKNDGSNISVSLQNKLQQQGMFTLFVHSGHKTVFVKTVGAQGPESSFTVPLDSLGAGISHFTLFGPNGNALCERLFFKKPTNLLNINLRTNQPNYTPREKVRLHIEQKNSIGLPAGSKFSVSVYKADTVANYEDIVTSLWLTSELKGKIKNASWYLSEASAEDIDKLMLTHGWRRFKWEDVLQEKEHQPKYLPEVDGHIVSGRLSSTLSNVSVANRMAFLSVPGRNYRFYTSSSNSNGEINFYTRDFYGGNEVIAQTDFRTDSLLHIEINSPYSSLFASGIDGVFNYSPNQHSLLQRSVATQVNNIYFSKYLNKETARQADTSFFYSKPDKIYKLDDYVRFTTMEEVLREYVPEVMVSQRKKNYQLTVFDTKLNAFHNGAPFALLDGVPIFDDGNTVIATDPRKLQRIEIVDGSYLYGRNSFSGILSLHSYKGDMAGYQLPKTALVIDYDGLQKERQFYSPMYNGDTANRTHMPDYRTTLFWEPHRQIGKNGETELEFYTSDLEGAYVINVQALSENGEAGSAIASFKILKEQ
ncbi:hypothetical protein BCY91_10940 [Pelobium manganitolerans]|uniref:Macroglobulin domain-containing protein n=1 Tax=Pelobium manganitolerans TaxID=1842495 RepID=A0A419S2U4_9SPHI|nr:Plug domain-containing protein [Pelobium manganitolerans]RKD13315.1 hypothetical protein BCY91_10940 [Pelobium manganitolerans]